MVALDPIVYTPDETEYRLKLGDDFIKDKPEIVKEWFSKGNKDINDAEFLF